MNSMFSASIIHDIDIATKQHRYFYILRDKYTYFFASLGSI